MIDQELAIGSILDFTYAAIQIKRGIFSTFLALSKL